MLFFVFQAEDGIRDKLVTGVQTCALPIWRAVCLDVEPQLRRTAGRRGTHASRQPDGGRGDGDRGALLRRPRPGAGVSVLAPAPGRGTRGNREVPPCVAARPRRAATERTVPA